MTYNRLQEEERLIFGAWLKGEHLEDIERLTPREFQNFPDIANAIMKEYKAQKGEVDPAKFLYAVKKRAKIEIKYLAELTSFYNDSSDMYDVAIKELLDQRAWAVINSANSNKSSLEDVQAQLGELIGASTSRGLPTPAKNFMMTYLDDLDDRRNRKEIKIGMPAFDNLLCGIRRTELITVAARPATGKSAFALQTALEVAKQGEKVLYFPLEMSNLQTYERIIRRMCDIPHSVLQKGNLERIHYAALDPGISLLCELEKSGNFLLFEGENNLSTIKKLVKKHKPYLIIVDQLEQLTDDKTFREKRERFSHMTNNLKRLAMSENIAVVLVAQINRTGRSEPTLEHLKESGSIEEDSDVVVILHERDPDSLENSEAWDSAHKPVLIMLAKNRNGPTGDLLSMFVANKYKFYELEN